MVDDKSLKAWVFQATDQLKGSSYVVHVEEELRILVEDIVGLKLWELQSGDVALTECQQRELNEALKKRLMGTPLEYVTKRKFFNGFYFRVEKGVFIPRSDTELLVCQLESYSKQFSGPWNEILDLGCGSGALGLSLLLKGLGKFLTGVDINPLATDLFLKNASMYGVLSKVRAITRDASQWLWEQANSWHWDLILMNPPYVGLNEPVGVEVAFYEPPCAIWSPEEGLRMLRQWLLPVVWIVKRKRWPKPVWIGIEHNEKHGSWVRCFLEESGFLTLEVRDSLGQFSHIHTIGVYVS